MITSEIISLVVTFIGVISFAAVFTILYSSYAHSQIDEIRSGKRDIEIIDEVIYNNKENIKKRRKIIALIKTILFFLTMIIIIPLFIISLISRIQNNTVMIGGNTIMVVGSGSMSEKHKNNSYLISNNLNNQFNTYDIIIIEKVNDKSDLKQYDVIAYYDSTKKINVIHRIIDINGDTYITRGDANGESDKFTPTFDDVIGRYTGKRIQGIGILVMFLQSYAGIITIVSLIYCLLMIDRYSTKIKDIQDKRSELLEQALKYANDGDSGNLKATYSETIYYKGFAYYFDENGFIEKKELSSDSDLSTDDTIIKEITNKDTSETKSEKIIIPDESEDENDD